MFVIRIFLVWSIILIFPYSSFSQGSETRSRSIANAAKKSSKAKKKMSWKKYHALCGAENGKREENFEKIKGRTILWVGSIAEITKDIALGQNRRWAETVIRMKMKPSDSLVADVRLRIPKTMEDKMMALEKGQVIGFKGKIMYLGTRLSDHVVEVEKFGKAKPKKSSIAPSKK